MKRAWFLHLRYFLFWVIYFIGAKTLFLLYHSSSTLNLSATEISKIFFYGLRLDFSFAGYLCLFPFLCFLLQALFPQIKVYRVVHAYTFIFLLLISLLSVVDLELYSAWGFRLDSTPFQYLSTPAEMAASAGNAPVLLLLLLFIFLTLSGAFFYYKFLFFSFPPVQKNTRYSLTCIWYLALLVLPMRGGWQHIPVNHSNVYFSNKLFANQAAVNVPWNILYSLSTQNYRGKNPYVYLPDSIAQQQVEKLYQPVPDTNIPAVLNQKRPNLLFIILESYTAKVVGCLGGEPGITPNLDQMARQGILFDSIYASGDRSEKGLVALLSGYPVQPFMSVVKTPHKTQKLPHLSLILKKEGYQSSFYYGGELAFANIKSYLVNAGYDKLISKFNFNSEDYNSKWGVHDHVLLNRVLQDLKKEQQPFFSTVFTLSSHEPYDIPVPGKFKGTDEATLFKNAAFYTDYALGEFFKKAQKEPWWPNTLVVLVADHGHRYPGNDPIDAPSKFRIPLILTGGALTWQNKIISRLGSQTDIAPTLLAQMDIPVNQFSWSKNLLNPSSPDFAFYVFQDGYGLVTHRGTVTVDNISKKIIRQEAAVTPEQIKIAKAYMQYSFEDFLQK